MAEEIEFNGVKFRRYPNAKQRSDRVYFTPGIGAKQRGVGRLHEEIWKAANGPIPEGHHIHHVDEDPLNNSIENLECLSAKQHLSDHHKGVCSDRKREHLGRVRHLAAAWHSSEEGRAWHRENAKTQLHGLPPKTFACEQCQQEFEAQDRGTNKFCSNNCKSAWRRASGLDNETRTCEGCLGEFTTNRYSKAKVCSLKCGWVVRKRDRAAQSL